MANSGWSRQAQDDIEAARLDADRIHARMMEADARLRDVEGSQSSYDSEEEWQAAVDEVERTSEELSEEHSNADRYFEERLAYWTEHDDEEDEDD